ncbi:MAG: helix-turn-helix transcriptional regulator, partial [Bacteroidales bacterium]|nr:helix-turn-helix transcriptional regulator [Bacteroidales bacterium]
QEELANLLCVSVQTVSRWENSLNYPDLAMLPEIATIFHVTTDYLLGVKGEPKMAKLLTTKETFQVNLKAEAETMVMNFQKEVFPKLLSYKISEEDGNIILVVEKEFGAEFDKMKFN